jgi:chemotaxis response regulator CheB
VGGITIAQRPDTAGQPDMPESAIASGCIDFVLTPEQIGHEIVRLARAAEVPKA